MTELYKIETYVPTDALEAMKEVLYESGIGKVGNYENCLNWYEVNSSWKPVAGANPYQGEVGQIEFANEYKIEFRCTKSELEEVVNLIKITHPYEEVFINIIPVIEI